VQREQNDKQSRINRQGSNCYPGVIQEKQIKTRGCSVPSD